MLLVGAVFAGRLHGGDYVIELKQAKDTRHNESPPGRFFLAPELQAAQDVNATVVGTREGVGLVVRTDNIDKLIALEKVKGASEMGDADKVARVQLLVGFDQGKGAQVVEALENAGFKIVKRSDRARYVLAEGDQRKEGMIAPAMLKALSGPVNESGASSATPNYKLKIPEPGNPRKLRRPTSADTRPNDEFFSYQWGLEDINAPRAWSVVRESPTIVAVIDTGIEVNHPDLNGNIWVNRAEAEGTAGDDDDGNGFVDDIYGWDFYNGDNSVFDDPSSDDHGTHVAGTIGAVSDNGTGVVGVNWKVQIMPVKFLGPDGGSTDGAIDGVYYAIDNGATILNNSWGGGGFSPVLERAIEEADSRSVLFVAAAGNGGFDQIGDDNDSIPHYPSSYDVPNVISVASVDEPDVSDETLSVFSNFGAESVDLAAPGGEILSTIPSGNYAF